MKNKPIAIVLGGTKPHITLIEILKNRGYYTVLIDYALDPVAKEFADEHVIESSMDKEKVLELAKDRKAQLVITTCSDQANVTACYVAEKLRLPAPYSYETALNVTDKQLMKTKMIEGGIPTSKFIIVDSLSKEYDYSSLKFPLIVKPVDSYGSKGVKITNNSKELSDNIENAIKISKTKKAIVEEYKIGEEIGIDCFVKNSKADIIITKHRRKIKNNDDSIQQIHGCIWPADISESTYQKLNDISNKIAEVFELENTPLMIQAIVNGNDVNVIEFGARIGGGNSYSIIKLSTGFDIVDAAVDSFLGLDVELIHHAPKGYYSDVFMYTKPAQFGYIKTGDLIKNNIVEYIVTNKNKGVKVGSDLSSANRVGALILNSDKKENLLEKIEIALSEIEVYDIDEKPIMRRDVYR